MVMKRLGVSVFFYFLQLARGYDSIWCDGISFSFTNAPPNDGIIPLPECPEDQGIVMTVYTRDTPIQGQRITRSSVPSNFKGERMTMFLVHGWLQSETFQWMHTLKNAALIRGDFNVIIVGWSVGALKLWYPQSVANTRTVGAEIALVSNLTIDQYGSSRANQYCVGHSLGAHVCGFAGQYGQFGRMTGMDPAGPLYDDRDWSCGLNPSCADFVDVIHTNGRKGLVFGLGTLKPLGHVDFYANKGTQQPGCFIDPFSGIVNLMGIFTSRDNTYDLALEITLGCSHIRAYEFMTESLLNPCFLSRHVCSSSDFPLFTTSLTPLPCESQDQPVQSLGFDANNPIYQKTGIFYLETYSKPPFCKN